MANDSDDLVFCTRSSYDYHEDKQLLIDLFCQCESTNASSISSGNTIPSSLCFHYETTDYLRCMEQYFESYCHYVKNSKNRRALAVYSTHWKRVHFGSSVVLMVLARLMRVDPQYRRQYLARHLIEHTRDFHQQMGPDYIQGYTFIVNSPSLELQKSHILTVHQSTYLLNCYVVGTKLNERAKSLNRLTQDETEKLWMENLSHWVQRPIISELRLLMSLPEYYGTFYVGDFKSNQFAAATIWQPLKTNLYDDRSNSKTHGNRCSLRVVLNFYQSTNGNEGEELLHALNHQAAIDGYPYLVYYLQQSSPFDELSRKENILGVATYFDSRMIVSERMFTMNNDFHDASIWLDPRDFNSLFFFDCLPTKISSRL